MERSTAPADVEFLRVMRERFGAWVREEVNQAIAEFLPQMATMAFGAAGARRPPKRPGARGAADAVHPDEQEWFSRQQVAKKTGYSVRTVTRWIDEGKLRATGERRDRISRYELERFMEEGPKLKGQAPDSQEEVEAEVKRLLDGDE